MKVLRASVEPTHNEQAKGHRGYVAPAVIRQLIIETNSSEEMETVLAV